MSAVNFMIAGHTCCLVDGCFGLIKKNYKQSDCDTLEQLQKEFDDSASVKLMSHSDTKDVHPIIPIFNGMTG